jgi:hypothetical protein
MLKTTLIYEQPHDYYDIFSYMLSLKENATIRELVNKTESLAHTYKNKIEKEASVILFDCDDSKQAYIQDKVNKYKGDLLEIFSEIFFNEYQADPAIGVKDYTPVSITDDYGVDATGINVNGHKVAIQVKYRANITDRIDYESVAKTFTSAICQHSINPVYDNIIYVLTTAQGCEFPPEKVLGNKLVTISKSIIANKVDGNLIFWENAYKAVYEALDRE